jgi:hypothetical protein
MTRQPSGCLRYFEDFTDRNFSRILPALIFELQNQTLMDITPQLGDKVTLKPKFLKLHKNLGMEYATVTKVFTSQTTGKKSYNLTSSIQQELKLVPEDQIVVLKAKAANS